MSEREHVADDETLKGAPASSHGVRFLGLRANVN